MDEPTQEQKFLIVLCIACIVFFSVIIFLQVLHLRLYQ